MPTWIALFRGINVGGNQPLPMKTLCALLENEGLADVRSYIQSGNVVFRSSSGSASSLAKRIGELVLKKQGFQPKVVVLSATELEQAAAANPFPAAEGNPKALHLFFLARKPTNPDRASLDRLKSATEAFALTERVFYLHTPDGFGTSRLAERAERLLQVDATARNWRTVGKLIEMTRDSA